MMMIAALALYFAGAVGYLVGRNSTGSTPTRYALRWALAWPLDVVRTARAHVVIWRR